MPTPERSELRHVVLPRLPAEAAAGLLGPPHLPAAVGERVAAARDAGAAATPVLLAMPAAAGRLLLARALHAASSRAGPLLAVGGRRPRLADLPGGTSVYIDVTALAPDAALALEAVLDDGVVWVLAGLEPGTELPVPLSARLGALVLEVPRLGERRAELPALAGAVLARLAQRRGSTPPRLDPAALARLVAHPWPGDLAELEAVMARALLGVRGDVLEARHLGLGPEAPGPAAVAPSAPRPADAELEFVLAELAHELRNPLVTIKTYADHLPALLEDAELRARFATLTGEAIERMDGLLENLLTFARLGPPRRQPVEVAPLLEGVIREMQPEAEGRTVRVRHGAGTAVRCSADPEQLGYALRNLVAGVLREVPAREELVLDTGANGVVTLRFSAGGAAERLRRLTAPEASGGDPPSLADPTLLPLAFRLARAVLERNGGALAVLPEGGDATTLVVRLPTLGPDGG